MTKHTDTTTTDPLCGFSPDEIIVGAGGETLAAAAAAEIERYPHVYDLVIRIPVFGAPDGRLMGEALTSLPHAVPGLPNAVETRGHRDLAMAVAAVREFAAENGVTVIED